MFYLKTRKRTSWTTGEKVSGLFTTSHWRCQGITKNDPLQRQQMSLVQLQEMARKNANEGYPFPG